MVRTRARHRCFTVSIGGFRSQSGQRCVTPARGPFGRFWGTAILSRTCCCPSRRSTTRFLRFSHLAHVSSSGKTILENILEYESALGPRLSAIYILNDIPIFERTWCIKIKGNAHQGLHAGSVFHTREFLPVVALGFGCSRIRARRTSVVTWLAYEASLQHSRVYCSCKRVRCHVSLLAGTCYHSRRRRGTRLLQRQGPLGLTQSEHSWSSRCSS